MRQILEAKLISVRTSIEEAHQEYDVNGISYYEGQLNLLEYLLDKCNEMMCSSHNPYEHDLYYDDADEFYYDPLEDYYSDLAMYKHEEISDMYNKYYHFSWGLGKNVMNTDSMWFTSDEIEAFREIWQRRLSA